MTKAELIKLLDPFNDDAEVLIADDEHMSVLGKIMILSSRIDYQNEITNPLLYVGWFSRFEV